MNPEEKFTTLQQKAKDVMLLQHEKEQIKSHVLDFMAKNPAGAGVLVSGFSWSLPWLRYATASLAAVAVVALSGAGFSLAAQNALPGDWLYSVKTGVNEKVLAWTKTSDEAKAQYQISLVDLRLQEIEKMTTERKLDGSAATRARTLLDTHIAGVKARANAQAKLRLEASLEAHAKVLDSLATQDNSDAVKINVQEILSDLRHESEQVRKAININLNQHE